MSVEGRYEGFSSEAIVCVRGFSHGKKSSSLRPVLEGKRKKGKTNRGKGNREVKGFSRRWKACPLKRVRS